MVARACKVDIKRPATLSDRSFLVLMSSRSREQCEPTRSSDYAAGVGARVAGHCGRRGMDPAWDARVSSKAAFRRG